MLSLGIGAIKRIVFVFGIFFLCVIAQGETNNSAQNLYAELEILKSDFANHSIPDSKAISRLKAVVDHFDVERDATDALLNSKIEQILKQIIKESPRVDIVYKVFDEIGLREKFKSWDSANSYISNNPRRGERLSELLRLKPIPSFPLGKGEGATAEMLNLSSLIHTTNSRSNYLAITASPDGLVNGLFGAGDGRSNYGEGFYLATSAQKNRYSDGYDVHAHLDPRAKEGIDFEIANIRKNLKNPDGTTYQWIVVKNRNALIIDSPAQPLQIEPKLLFRKLLAGKPFPVSSAQKLQRELAMNELAKKLLTLNAKETKEIIKILESAIKKASSGDKAAITTMAIWLEANRHNPAALDLVPVSALREMNANLYLSRELIPFLWQRERLLEAGTWDLLKDTIKQGERIDPSGSSSDPWKYISEMLTNDDLKMDPRILELAKISGRPVDAALILAEPGMSSFQEARNIFGAMISKVKKPYEYIFLEELIATREWAVLPDSRKYIKQMIDYSRTNPEFYNPVRTISAASFRARPDWLEIVNEIPVTKEFAREIETHILNSVWIAEHRDGRKIFDMLAAKFGIEKNRLDFFLSKPEWKKSMPASCQSDYVNLVK